MASTFTGPVRTRVVDDGFWIESSGLPVGSVIDCRYTAGGQSVENSVTFQGGSSGQFVFTGSRPGNVSIVVRPTGGGISGSPLGRAAGLMSDYTTPIPPVTPPPQPSRYRNPPAY